MPDKLGEIGALDFNSKREELYYINPIQDNGNIIKLDNKDLNRTNVYKKMSSKKELNKKIQSLKKHYQPYLNSHYKCNNDERMSFYLNAFDKYTLPSLEHIDIQKVIKSKKVEWETVSIPEYSGPVGNSISLYKTNFNININKNKAYFIHFQCADYICEVHLNNNYIGSHEGFFGSFEFDITPYIKNGNNTLLIILKNDYKFDGEESQNNDGISLQGDKMYAATGMGFDDPIRGWHHCPAGYGLCGKIKIEERNRTFISDIFASPDIDKNRVNIETNIYRCDYYPIEDVELKYKIFEDNFGNGNLVKEFSYIPFTLNHINGSEIIYENDIDNLKKSSETIKYKYFIGNNQIKLSLNFDNYKLWAIDSPCLYRVVIELYIGDNLVDKTNKTFGMRKFMIDTSSEMKGKPYFNNSPIKLRGANTMGYEQQDVLRNDFDQLLYDMLMAKACNLNFLRITQRPVQDEIYDLCDRIGLLIQSDLPLFTAIRRTKYTFALKQCEELCFLIRNHPCCVIMSYINEPMVNANNYPHRHLTRKEMNDFFNSCDSVVSNLNPNIAVKHIDGDYDPPDTTLPDNHCYCFWYNGHGIDMGKLIKGYWVGIKKDWYCACGEYGSEGLDPYPLMKRHYPKSWLPKNENDSTWSPKQIKDSQTQNMHYFFYPTQNNINDWIKESHNWQKLATRLQTEALRRNRYIVSSAIHLFIDAWPSGWMKTLVDCERNPKPALFEYADAISPILCSIRPDRTSYYAEEKAKFSTYICNDTNVSYDNCQIKYELLDSDNKVILSKLCNTSIPDYDVYLHGTIVFNIPKVKNKTSFTFRMILLNNNKVIHYNDQIIKVFVKEKTNNSNNNVFIINGSKELANITNLDKLSLKYDKIIINNLDEGDYEILSHNIKVKKTGMRPLHFVSCKTNHPYVNDFDVDDFRFWYNQKDDMITPILYKTFIGENITPILLSGNTLKGSAWINPVYEAYALGEFIYNDCQVIINLVDFDSHNIEPVADILYTRISTSGNGAVSLSPSHYPECTGQVVSAT